MTPDEPPGAPRADDDDATGFPVVGIGASAGWYDAVNELLQSLPAEPGFAIVLVLHLDPQHESHMQQVLGRMTSLPVVEATDGTIVESDHVYVIPRDSLMTIEGDALRLEARAQGKGHQHVIDRFFRSLAKERGGRAVGVILSGTLSDGMLGLRDIRTAGGYTFAQSPETAMHREMPSSAIGAGYADFVLSPTGISAELVRLRDKLGEPRGSVSEPTEATLPPAVLDELLRALRNRTGADFSQYKRTTVRRRVMRRMTANHKDKLEDYVQLVRADQDEANALYEELLVHVTHFFRDEAAYKALADHVLPDITRDRAADQPIRAWVPGCATGEEAYSLAILVSELLQREGRTLPLQIFATDISERTLKTAREGLYPETIADDVSPERLLRYFEKAEGGYRVTKSLRSKVVFALHNVTTDPPFSNMDIVSCRNVLVYMEADLQRRVLASIHYALKPAGVLLLGTSETVGRSEDLFRVLEDDRHVYYKRNVVGQVLHQMPRAPAFAALPLAPSPRPSALWSEHDLQREADRVMLDRFAPAGLILNEDLEIVHFRGKTSPYLEPSPGPASLSLVKLAREGLALEIRQAVQDAKGRQGSVRRTNVRFTGPNKQEQATTIEVTPISGPSPRDRYYLVLFLPGERGGATRSGRKHEGPGALGAFLRAVRRGSSRSEGERVAELERELASTREYLQSVIEDHEATTEELRSANEEAISSNEELQSTNEELETAKEELQSTNEELSTLNDELMQRNQEIQRVNNDLLNLLNSVPQAIVMVGPDLRVRRFTPKAEQVLNLIPTDLGRPLTDIRHPFEGVDLRADLMRVLESFVPREVQARDAAGQRYTLHFHPYRTSDNRVDGVVLVITPLPR